MEYLHPNINSTERYITAGEEKECKGQGTGGTAFDAEQKQQEGGGREREGKRKSRGPSTGGTAFEADKKNRRGRGAERKGKKKAGGQGTGGTAFDAEQIQAGRATERTDEQKEGG